jgi:RHS repeat-associated protein
MKNYSINRELKLAQFIVAICLMVGFSQKSSAQCYAAAPNVSFSASGGSTTTTAQGGCSDGSAFYFQIGQKPSWISSAYNSGNTIYVSAVTNTGAARNGTVQLTRNGVQIGVFSVSQAAGGPPPVGQVSITSGPTNLCQGTATSDYNASASNATSYVWSIQNGGSATINSSTGLVSWNGFSGNAIVRVTAYGANSSSSTTTRGVTVTAVSTPGLQTNTNEVCAGQSATLTLGPLQSSVRYELLLNGATTGFEVTTNSSGQPGGTSWNVTSGGTYSVRATQQVSPNCSITWGSLPITTTAGVGNPSIDGPNQLCSGTSQTNFDTAGGSSENSYSWSILNGGAATINSTTGLVNWNGFTGTATVRLTANPLCGNNVNINKNVTVTAVSTPGLQTNTNEVCAGQSATLTLGPLQSSVRYELLRNGATTGFEVTTNSSGQPGGTSWNVTSGGTYSVRATQQVSPNCSITWGSLPITEQAGPGNPTIDGPSQLCSGTSQTNFDTTGGSSENSYSWSILNGGAATINSTTGLVNWNGFSGTATVRLTAIPECGNTVNINKNVTVTAVSTPGLQTNTNEVCAGQSATLTLGPLQSSVRYELLRNGATTGFEVTTDSSGQPGGTSWNVTSGGTYSVRATQQVSPNCSITWGSLPITEQAGPGNPTIDGPSQLCSDTVQTNFDTTGGSSENSYSWSILNGGAATINSTTGLVNWNGFSGTATVRLTVTPECGNNVNITKNVTLNQAIFWYADSDGDGYKDPDGEIREQCDEPTTGNWTSNPQPVDDLCPNDPYPQDGSNGCNPTCLPFSTNPGALEFTDQGGTQTAIVNMGCTAGFDIEIDIPSNNEDWLTVNLINGNQLDITVQPGIDAKDITINIRVNGNSGGGVRILRNASDPPDPDPCTTNAISDIVFSSFSDSQDVTVSYVGDCVGTLNLVHPYEEVPDWLQIIPNGNTFTLSVQDNASGITQNTILIPVLDDGQGGITPIGTFFQVTQTSCSTAWYLDSDNDGLGDIHGNPIVGCNDPDTLPNDDPSTSWVSNNNDLCPEVSGSSANQGCPAGELPENYNTVTSWAYDITGTLRGAGKGYFDELGMPIQNQVWNIRTNELWASEVKYDPQGRPALQTLSSPIVSGNSFAFKEGFIKRVNNTNYQISDFTGSNLENPVSVGNGIGSLGWYYSEANNRESYQDITARPFTNNVYSSLNPGTILRTVGGNKVDTNQDGTINDGTDSWAQGYSFTMRASQELSENVAFGITDYDNDEIYKTVVRDVHGVENVVFTDSDGKTLAAARCGLLGNESSPMVLPILEQGYVDIHISEGITGFTISGSNSVTVYDLISEETETSTTNLGKGFYRVAIDNLESYSPGSVTISYTVNYYDYSLNEYDDANRLVASYQPLEDGTGNKLATTYEFNALGQLTKTISPDEGTAEFIYREDGQIRFSQNSKQALLNEVSYTDYDELARPIESGVMLNASFGFLNSESPSGTQKKEQNLTTYDAVPDNLELSTILPNAYQTPSFLVGNVAITQNDQSTTYYSYDVYGRVKWIAQDVQGLGVKTIDYVYNPITGLVEEVHYQKGISGEQFIHKYNYDITNQLSLVETSSDGGNTWRTHAEYLYYETGALKRTELADGAQGLDYVYNISGQLKSLNHPSLSPSNDPGSDTNDLFGMQIDYHTGDYQRTTNTNIATSTFGIDQLNGNIKGIRWNNTNPNTTESEYVYSYDRNNWLTAANFDPSGSSVGTGGLLVDDSSSATYTNGQTDVLEATNSYTLTTGFHAQAGSTVTVRINPDGGGGIMAGDYDVSNITYDANGNIETLTRNRGSQNGDNAMDNLSYNYKDDKPNQLEQVVDNTYGNTGDAPDTDDIATQASANNYIYNQIGQLIRNEEEDLDYFYNASGLVTEVKKTNLTVVKFYYNDRNHRVRKETHDGGGIPFYNTFYVRDVAGQVMAIYNDISGTPSLSEQPIYGSGRIGVAYNGTNNSKNYIYELTDHLGNVRTVFSRSGAENNLAEGYTDYYPFGMPMPGRNMTGADQYRYAFQGQEKDPETGKEAFELRLWDARIGRWLTTDPYRQYASPYLGMGNDPISGVDPDGGKKVYYNEDGSYSHTTHNNFFHNLFNGIQNYIPGSEGGFAQVSNDYFWNDFVANGGGVFDVQSAMTPFDVGVEWLTGTGPRHRDFGPGDTFTEMLKNHEHVKQTEAIIGYKLKNDLKTYGFHNYSLSGIQGVGKYIKDYSTLATAGKTGNLAVTYLGSYRLEYSIADVNVELGVAEIHFTVHNSSTIQSATRPPVLGYTDAWKNGPGRLINDAFQSGPLSPTTQTLRWKSVISF